MVFQSKVEAIASALKGVPVQVFVSAAKGSSVFRKPRTGIWELFRRDKNGTCQDIDMEESFYCGDAAGRTKKASDGKKDFACSDRWPIILSILCASVVGMEPLQACCHCACEITQAENNQSEITQVVNDEFEPRKCFS